jgi:hypothetical protein
MLRGSFATLAVLLLTTAARAEVPSPVEALLPPPVAPATTVAPATPVVPATPVAPATPPAESEATAPPPLAVGGPPSAFMERFLSYDAAAGVVVQGRARQPLSRDELYARLDRPDLLERSRAAAQRRLLFSIAAGTVFVAGVTTAVAARVAMPDLNRGVCTDSLPIYNTVCVPKEQTLTTVATAGLVGGIALGALLGALAYWSSPDVLSKDETSSLISQHNAGLLKRLRSESAAFHVTPYASVQGGGVVAAVTF